MALAVLAACSLNPFSSSNDDNEDPSTKFRGDAGTGNFEDPKNPAIETLPDPFTGLPRGADQLATVCGRGASDAVTRALCSNPSIDGLKQLQNTLGLTFVRTSSAAGGLNGQGGNPAFAMLANSSSLVARDVSAINPRAFVFSSPAGRGRVPGFVVTGFARGELFVEIAAHDQTRDAVDFYLVKFELPCSADNSCKPGDLLTPNVETGWTGWTLYGDEDLKNTIVDCRHCHAPGGGSTAMGLRMQELADPWTHWMRNDRPGGIALFKDFLRAHGDTEDYAGIPAGIIQKADGLAMEDLVNGNGFSTQPNVFDTKKIEAEVAASARAQPDINDPPGVSATWQRLYDNAALGGAIPPPYHDVKVTDATKLQFASDQYIGFRNGSVAASALPDIRRVFLDAALPDMTIRPKVGATGREILVQMCVQCHNSRLDQNISRARFNIENLDTMTAAQKQAAIARMQLPASQLGHMPPAFMRSIPDDQLQVAIQALQ